MARCYRENHIRELVHLLLHIKHLFSLVLIGRSNKDQLLSIIIPCLVNTPLKNWLPLRKHVPKFLHILFQALEKYNIEKDIAAYIKKEFDKKYNPTWHCIVGRNFGSYVTHETKHFVYFYLGQVAILLFKSG